MLILVAISAPTAYAVRIADDTGLTLVGFARRDRHTVYACARAASCAARDLVKEAVARL